MNDFVKLIPFFGVSNNPSESQKPGFIAEFKRFGTKTLGPYFTDLAILGTVFPQNTAQK